MADSAILAGGAQLSILMGPLTFSAAPPELARALVEAQVTSAAGQRSGFQLRFALARGGFVETELLANGFFEPPMRVILVAIFNGIPTVLSDGVIGRVDVGQSSHVGASTLTVSGSDVSQMMDLADLSGVPMPAMPAVARVYFILARYAMYGVIPVAFPSVLDVTPNPLDEIPGQQGTDYAYLSQLADEAGYVFFVEPQDIPGVNTAYWGPEIRVGLPQPPLRVNMGTASNVDQMSFSYDGLRKTLYAVWINEPISHVNFPLPLPDMNPLSPPQGLIPVPPRQFRQLGHSAPAARSPSSPDDRRDATSRGQIPRAIVRGLARAAQSSNVVSATGSLDARRYGGILRARQLVNVQGASIDFDGQYFVRSVTTTLKRGALTQSFALERNALRPFSDTVPG
jgi:hypothetical protein